MALSRILEVFLTTNLAEIVKALLIKNVAQIQHAVDAGSPTQSGTH